VSAGLEITAVSPSYEAPSTMDVGVIDVDVVVVVVIIIVIANDDDTVVVVCVRRRRIIFHRRILRKQSVR
jgi:hypothetical protein